jgi:hypothetical protein
LTGVLTDVPDLVTVQSLTLSPALRGRRPELDAPLAVLRSRSNLLAVQAVGDYLGTMPAGNEWMAARALATQEAPASPVGPVSWERMIRAVEKVRERLRRAAAALEAAGVPYAVAGGNAVAAWVSRVDAAAVRNTQDVDILLRRADLPAAITAMTQAGFVHRHAAGLEMFLDGPAAGAREAVQVVFAAEKVRPDYLVPAPDVTESETTAPFQLLTLNALVRMKLTSFHDNDRTHLRDLIEVGLVDAAWVRQLPEELAGRLQRLLDTPGG